MKIDKIRLKNFRCFSDKEIALHPEFNLIVGVNGTGKTSVLEALSIAQGTWMVGLKQATDQRSIKTSEARLTRQQFGDEFRYMPQYPVEIQSWGTVMGQEIQWMRSKDSEQGRTRYSQATELIQIAKSADESVRKGKTLNLPLIAYYGTMRLWQEPRDFQKASRVKRPEKILQKQSLSYFEGYRFSVDPRISITHQVAWFARQAWISFEEGRDSWAFVLIKQVLLQCLEGATDLRFDPRRGELMLHIQGHEPQPYMNLSDGQKAVLAMVSDMIQKAVWLNPHLGQKVLQETEGIVLIDELDLHLHPRWQRRIISDLRSIFPKIQFICTTHSPQLVGQVKPDEIIVLMSESDDIQQPEQSYGMDTNWILKHIMGAEDRDPIIEAQFEHIFSAIEEADLEQARILLTKLKREIGQHPDLVEAEALVMHYERMAEAPEA